MTAQPDQHPVNGLDDVVHQRVRLGILTVARQARRVEFGFLRTSLALTAGNISEHLTPDPDSRIPVPRTPDVRIPVPRTPDVRIPVPRTPDVRIPVPRPPDVRIPVPRTPDVRIPVPRPPDPDSRTPDSRTPERRGSAAGWASGVPTER